MDGSLRNAIREPSGDHAGDEAFSHAHPAWTTLPKASACSEAAKATTPDVPMSGRVLLAPTIARPSPRRTTNPLPSPATAIWDRHWRSLSRSPHWRARRDVRRSSSRRAWARSDRARTPCSRPHGRPSTRSGYRPARLSVRGSWGLTDATWFLGLRRRSALAMSARRSAYRLARSRWSVRSWPRALLLSAAAPRRIPSRPARRRRVRRQRQERAKADGVEAGSWPSILHLL